MNKKSIIFGIIAALLFSIIMWQWISQSELKKSNSDLSIYNYQLRFLLGIGDLNSVHQHADIKVYLNGKSIDFSQKKYQLTTNYIHFEDGIGDVMHIHASGITVGHMLRGVGMAFTNECLKINEENYCNDDKNSLKFYVNGKPNILFDNYAVQDLDKLLVSYGPKTQDTSEQLASVTDLARVYSKK